ncbi:MAG: rRNA maturation RNase YbeY [Corallococcus sp.]|nr:rRNA maturation RNase YbeY [Corallococcus sp.]
MKVIFGGADYFTKRDIAKVYNCAMTYLQQDGSKFEVSLDFVSDDEIRALNAQTRGIDKVTDVLSFPTADNLRGKPLDLADFTGDVDPQTGKMLLGDIVICKQVAYAQAREYGHGKRREICFLALHGLLHLLGYDHIEPQDEAEMTEIQRAVLEQCGFGR